MEQQANRTRRRRQLFAFSTSLFDLFGSNSSSSSVFLVILQAICTCFRSLSLRTTVLIPSKNTLTDLFCLALSLSRRVSPSPQASTSQSATITPSAAAPTVLSGSEEFEYSDTTKMACLLCQRQLKSLELLRKHNLGSDLHKARSTLSSLFTHPHPLVTSRISYVLSSLSTRSDVLILDLCVL